VCLPDQFEVRTDPIAVAHAELSHGGDQMIEWPFDLEQVMPVALDPEVPQAVIGHPVHHVPGPVRGPGNVDHNLEAVLSRAAPLEVGRRAAASAGVVAAIMAAITPARAKVASLPMAFTSFGPPVGDLPAILRPRLSGTCGGGVAGPWMVSPGGLLEQ